MAEAAAVNPADVFPRYGFSATEPGEPVKDSATGATVCNSRLFTSQAELDARGRHGRVESHASRGGQAPATAKATDRASARRDDEETPARRSHR